MSGASALARAEAAIRRIGARPEPLELEARGIERLTPGMRARGATAARLDRAADAAERLAGERESEAVRLLLSGDGDRAAVLTAVLDAFDDRNRAAALAEDLRALASAKRAGRGE